VTDKEEVLDILQMIATAVSEAEDVKFTAKMAPSAEPVYDENCEVGFVAYQPSREQYFSLNVTLQKGE
jgi:hypothetical protein